MSDAWPRLQSLPQDGLLWLLTWLGPFYFDTTVSSQRLLLAALSCVNDSAGKTPAQLFGRSPPRPDQLGRQRLVSFAVGELPTLTDGTFFRDRQPLTVGQGALQRRTSTLDFSQQSVFRLQDVPADHRVIGGYRPWLESPPDPVHVEKRTESKARSGASQTPCIGWLWSVFEPGSPLKSYLYGK